MHIKNKKYWVTLVELIIGVTIVIVLWTIGLISFQSYALTIRDTSRITDIEKISVALEDYKIRNHLPQPDNYVSIEQWNKLISQQWELTKDILHLIEFERGWLDPKNQDFYTYTRSGNNKYFQIMWLLEDDRNVPANKNQPDIQISAERFPYSQWSKLWILTDEKNIPIEKNLAWKDIQIDNHQEPLLAHLENNHFTYWTGAILSWLEKTNKQWGKYCKVEENKTISCNKLSDQRRKWTGFETISWNQAIWYNDLPENIKDIFDTDLPYVSHWKDNNCLKENIEIVEINTTNFKQKLCDWNWNESTCQGYNKQEILENKIYVFSPGVYEFDTGLWVHKTWEGKTCNAIIWEKWQTIFTSKNHPSKAIIDAVSKWHILYWFSIDAKTTSWNHTRWIKISDQNVTLMNIDIKNATVWIEANSANSNSWDPGYFLSKNISIYDSQTAILIEDSDNFIISNANIYNNSYWFQFNRTNTSITNVNAFNNTYAIAFNGGTWVMNNANIFNNQKWIFVYGGSGNVTFNNLNIYDNTKGIHLDSNRNYSANNLTFFGNEDWLYNEIWTVKYYWNLWFWENTNNYYNAPYNGFLEVWENSDLFNDWVINTNQTSARAIPNINGWDSSDIWPGNLGTLNWFTFQSNLAKQTQPLKNETSSVQYYGEDKWAKYDYDSSKFIWQWD